MTFWAASTNRPGGNSQTLRVICLGLALLSLVEGFSPFASIKPASGTCHVASSSALMSSLLPPESETSKAMTAYLAKNHEERLKTLEIIKAKDNEIQRLKAQLEAKGGASGMVETASMGEEEMKMKLAAYQKFMADYIVRAQEDKARAIKAAEAALKQKFEDKLKLLLEGGDVAPPLPAATTTTTTPAESAFEKRSAKLKETGVSSRWAPSEISRVVKAEAIGSRVDSPPPMITNIGAALLKANGAAKPVSSAVIAEADHGLHLEGSLSLAERVNQGAAASVVTTAPSTSLYAKRNARVAEAAQAGKSRWGAQEIAKIQTLAKEAPKTMPVAASKILSLQDRVNFGVKALETAGALQATGSSFASLSLKDRVNLGASAVTRPKSSLFMARNQRVAESAKAGKSRWGDQEVQRIMKENMWWQ